MGRPRILTDEERRRRKNARSKAWREANPERSRALVKAWHEANRERKAASNKAWFEANPGYDKAWYQANSARRIVYAKAWKKANPDANRESNRRGWAKRRARILGAFVESVDYDAIFVRDGGVCQICDTFIGDAKWHIDHRIPLSKGGEHSYVNCQLAHAKCNISKRDKIPTTTKGQTK